MYFTPLGSREMSQVQRCLSGPGARGEGYTEGDPKTRKSSHLLSP